MRSRAFVSFSEKMKAHNNYFVGDFNEFSLSMKGRILENKTGLSLDNENVHISSTPYT